jgi:hypothetical protein
MYHVLYAKYMHKPIYLLILCANPKVLNAAPHTHALLSSSLKCKVPWARCGRMVAALEPNRKTTHGIMRVCIYDTHMRKNMGTVCTYTTTACSKLCQTIPKKSTIHTYAIQYTYTRTHTLRRNKPSWRICCERMQGLEPEFLNRYAKLSELGVIHINDIIVGLGDARKLVLQVLDRLVLGIQHLIQLSSNVSKHDRIKVGCREHLVELRLFLFALFFKLLNLLQVCMHVS